MDKDGIGAVYFPIIATAVGKVKLQVEARTSIIADAVERELLIEVIIENIAHIKLLQFTYTQVGDHIITVLIEILIVNLAQVKCV